LELFTVHHAMISYFRRFSIHYYTTIINTTLDQDMNFFLPSANIKEKNDAVSRRANSFGISTLLAFHFTTDLKKARRVSLKTANSK